VYHSIFLIIFIPQCIASMAYRPFKIELIHSKYSFEKCAIKKKCFFCNDGQKVGDGLYKSVVKTNYKIEVRYVEDAGTSNANVFIIRIKRREKQKLMTVQ